MRRLGATIVAAALLLGTASGCGTLLNVGGVREFAPSCDMETQRKIERPPFPFGGVANDMSMLLGGSPGIWIDLPITIVGDVITLPWVTYEYTREKLYPTNKYDTYERNRAIPSAITNDPIPEPSGAQLRPSDRPQLPETRRSSDERDARDR